MSELRRLGEMVDFDSEYRTGDDRIIQGLDNLGGTILFPDERLVIKDFYVTSTHMKRVTVLNLGEIEIGDYEGSILDKLIKPIRPVICVTGRIGSGKTTTMRYIMENFIDKIEFGERNVNGHSLKRLTAWVDFSNFLTEKKATLHDLIDAICTQLWNKCIYLLDDEHEFHGFWEHLLKLNEFGHDHFVEQVVGIIHSEYPEIRNVKIVNGEEIKKRGKIKAKIKDKNLIWYLRYLILLYRYIIQTRFSGQKEGAIITLDNVDSLSTDLQRNLVRIIVGCAHAQGPTFVILVRPETFERNGLNDILQDIIVHQNPEPYQIVFDRIERFLKEPEMYFQAAQTLTPEEKSLAIWYLKKIFPKLKQGKTYREFIRSISGRNIRNALVLAQSVFQLTVGEMNRRDLTVHYLIRAMVRLGRHQYRSYQNPRVVNPFDVEGITDGRFLTKIRLLKYIAGRGGNCRTPTIISTFSLFNSLNLVSKYDAVTKALEELLRNDCQLLTSNGFDAFHITPDDDQDEISITEIGRGYIDHLIYNIHFIQEVMLDARVRADFPASRLYTDKLAEKIDVMVKFLERVYHSEVEEVNIFQEKGMADYAKIFQPRLISLDIICRTYESTRKLLQSRMLRKRKNIILEYEDVLSDYQNLMYKVLASNNHLFGVSGQTRPEPE
jgi:hypothetical protein